jgi:hypothetical protein
LREVCLGRCDEVRVVRAGEHDLVAMLHVLEQGEASVGAADIGDEAKLGI